MKAGAASRPGRQAQLMGETLFEEVGPLGNVQAVVECDKRACYFYLNGADDTDFGMRSVWVRNLVAAPEDLDVAAMRRGDPPLNPMRHCRTPAGLKPPRAKDLRVVWLPEGNGAALLESNEIIAAIPPWSGEGGFHGYARDAVGEGPVAWALEPAGEFISRIRDAEHFTEEWANSDPWPELRDRLTQAISAQLGQYSNYYGIDGGYWPPRAMLRIPRDDSTVFLTAGMCILPQPNAVQVEEDARQPRRVELGAVLPPTWSNEEVVGFGRYISAQAGLPWSRLTWLGHGHTIPCNSWKNPEFTSALLVDTHPAIGRVNVGQYRGDPITALWFLPITAAETERAIAHGSDTLFRDLDENRWQRA